MKWLYKLNDTEPTADDVTTSNIASGPNIIFSSAAPASGNIKISENKIFFYSDMTEQSALELNHLLHDLDQRLRTVSTTFEDYKPHIKLHINSFGGSLFAAMAVVDTIRNLKSDVHTYIDGAAASAATIISVVGKKRYIGKNSMMLIHQLSTGAYGKFSELEDDMENNKRLMQSIKNIYKQYTKVPMKKLDEILKHDIWFDATTCLEYGLVDEVL
jgi:ATP-dependent Clp endopeptidase proteolytic subunit ClpP